MWYIVHIVLSNSSKYFVGGNIVNAIATVFYVLLKDRNTKWVQLAFLNSLLLLIISEYCRQISSLIPTFSILFLSIVNILQTEMVEKEFICFLIH